MKATVPLKQRIFLLTGSVVLLVVVLEIALHLGGFIFLFLQERSNIASIREKGEYRIMCLGESTTALGGKDSYPSQLEDILNQSGKRIKFSVINKGIPASNTTALLLQLEENIDKYKPDMVITMMGINETHTQHAPFLSNFKTCNLFRLLSMHIAVRLREIQTPRYVRLGWHYKEQGRFIQAVESFKKAIELNPRSVDAFLGLGYSYLELRDFVKMERSFKKAIEINPKDGKAYVFLGFMYYCCLGKLPEAESLLKKAIEINPRDEDAYFKLGWFYRQQDMLAQTYESFKKIIELNPLNERAYGALAALCEERGEPEEAIKYYTKIRELRLGYYDSITRDNYQRTKSILDKRGIKLVCVQYPVHSIEPLKEMFVGNSGVLFVDNESIFKEALRNDGYGEYFTDMFAGDFGHCTPKGNRILAGNIANVILKEYFNN